MAGRRDMEIFGNIQPRACLKIAFCKIASQFASDFMLDLGGVVGYIYEIQHITRCKVGRKIVGMNFQTRSKATILYFSKIWQIGALGRHIHFSVAVCGNSRTNQYPLCVTYKKLLGIFCSMPFFILLGIPNINLLLYGFF